MSRQHACFKAWILMRMSSSSIGIVIKCVLGSGVPCGSLPYRITLCVQPRSVSSYMATSTSNCLQ
jgi:hypothetical protein